VVEEEVVLLEDSTGEDTAVVVVGEDMDRVKITNKEGGIISSNKIAVTISSNKIAVTTKIKIAVTTKIKIAVTTKIKMAVTTKIKTAVTMVTITHQEDNNHQTLTSSSSHSSRECTVNSNQLRLMVRNQLSRQHLATIKQPTMGNIHSKVPTNKVHSLNLRNLQDLLLQLAATNSTTSSLVLMGSNRQQLQQLVTDSKQLHMGSSSLKHRLPQVMQLLLLTVNSTLHMANLQQPNNYLPYK